MPQRHRRNLGNRLDKWLQIINLEKLIGLGKLIIVQRCLRILRSVCQTDHPHGPWRIHKNPTGNKPQRQLLQFFVFRFKTRIDDACSCCSREYYAPSCMCVMPIGQLCIEKMLLPSYAMWYVYFFQDAQLYCCCSTSLPYLIEQYFNKNTNEMFKCMNNKLKLESHSDNLKLRHSTKADTLMSLNKK